MPQFKVFPPKDPEAELDYIFDWAAASNNNGLTDWLREGEIILTYSVEVPDGLNLVSDDLINDGTAVLVWLDGGDINVEYVIKCSIETNQDRTDVRRASLTVKER